MVLLSAGMVTYCIFWLLLPLSVICVSTLSIVTLPTPSANIGNLPAVPSGKYILSADIKALVDSWGFISSSKVPKPSNAKKLVVTGEPLVNSKLVVESNNLLTTVTHLVTLA